MAIKTWFKNNWPHILSFGLTFLIGFIVGRRKPVSSADGRVADIRSEFKKLEREAAEARRAYNAVRESNKNNIERIEYLEAQLSEAERTIQLARQLHIDRGDDIEAGTASIERIRNLIERNREELEKITISE